jgi:chromosome segregation ATPase
MRAQPDGGQALLEGVLSLPSDTQVAHCLDVLAHLATTDITSQKSIGAALAGCYEDLLRRIRSAADRQHPPSPIAGAYERLAEALPLPEWRHSLKQQQARVEDQVAGERAREERTKQDYSDSVAQHNQLSAFEFLERPTLAAIPTEIESKAARERARLSQHIEELEGELTAVREAREAAENELNRLRSEHADLDKLFSLKLELEQQLKLQVQQVRQEQRRREEADEHRRQAEERGDTVQLQLETQFLRAEHEAREREKAQNALRAKERDLETQFLRAEDEAREREKAQNALRAAQREIKEGEAARQTIRSELEKSKTALQVIPELRKQLARLQHNRKKMLVIAPSIGIMIGAALIGILISVIH